MNNDQLLIQTILACALVILMCRILGVLLSTFGQPRVVGEMLAGILLGPTCLGYFCPAVSSQLFTKESISIVFILGSVGVTIYMFLTALELTAETLEKQMIRQSIRLALWVIVVPLAIGIGVGAALYSKLKGIAASATPFALFIGCAMALTAFPVLARILADKKLTNTRTGKLLLFSAAIQDLLTWSLLIVIAILVQNNTGSLVMRVVPEFGGFFLLLLLSRLLLRKWLAKSRSGKFAPNAYYSAVLGLLLGFSLLANYIGLHLVFGAFAFGLILPRDKATAAIFSSKLSGLSANILIPLYFAFSGLRTDLTILAHFNDFVLALIILLASFAGKYFTTFVVFRSAGFDNGEASAAGGLMNARGMMELIIANIGLTSGLITSSVYSILVLLALTSTFLAVPIYDLSVNGRRARILSVRPYK